MPSGCQSGESSVRRKTTEAHVGPRLDADSFSLYPTIPIPYYFSSFSFHSSHSLPYFTPLSPVSKWDILPTPLIFTFTPSIYLLLSESLEHSTMSHPNAEDQKKVAAAAAAAAAARQSDNITHALAGAGGGILSMVLTYVYQPT